MSYKVHIDHALLSHLTEQVLRLGGALDHSFKIYTSIYFFHVKGYLTSVDLLNEIAASKQILENSELTKTEFFAKIFGEEGAKLDPDVKSQLVASVKKLRDQIDIGYYGLDDLFKTESAPTGEAETTETAEPTVPTEPKQP